MKKIIILISFVIIFFRGNLQDEHAKNHQIIKNSVKEENLLLVKN